LLLLLIEVYTGHLFLYASDAALRTTARQVKWPGWKIHRPGSSPA